MKNAIKNKLKEGILYVLAFLSGIYAFKIRQDSILLLIVFIAASLLIYETIFEKIHISK